MATSARARPVQPKTAARPLYAAEPSARYSAQPPAVVDASLIAALLFAEAEQAQACEQLLRCQPVAPELLAYEIANVAASKLRRGHDEAALRSSLADLPLLGIALHPVDAAQAFDLAARYGLTACDAAYLALAAQLRCPLYTFDRRLADAAQQHLGRP